MGESEKTMSAEDRLSVPFFSRMPVSVDRGSGVYVWDQEGRRYMDLTAGWGVTSIGHAHPVIVEALARQGARILQNPNSGLTYSPERARLLELLSGLLPRGLARIFFANSGAEANDAVIKLARKASGRMDIVSTHMSFHGRTISTASATGQTARRAAFNPLMANYRFVPFDDIRAMEEAVDDGVAAVLLEPIQGEGGVNIPRPDYLARVSELCRNRGAYLIMDEVQTGFFRTGPCFASDLPGVRVDFITLAKGIAGGFPFAAFAMTGEIAAKMEKGDHGGTYSGNPLGCAVSYAVIRHMLDTDIGANVREVGGYALERLRSWSGRFPGMIGEARGRGLLLAVEIADPAVAGRLEREALSRGLILNIRHGSVLRIFPALNITRKEMDEALSILEEMLEEWRG